MEINLLAVVLAATAAMIVGALWYSPMLFGKKWMGAVGKSPDVPGAMMPRKELAIQFVGALVVAYVFAYLAAALGYQTIGDVIVLGLWIWAGFYATMLLDSVLWEGRPWILYFINASQRLASILLMAIVIGWLQ